MNSVLLLRKGEVLADTQLGTPKGSDKKPLGHMRQGRVREGTPARKSVPSWLQRLGLLLKENDTSCSRCSVAAHQRAFLILNSSCMPGERMTKCIAIEVFRLNLVCYPQRDSISLKFTLDGLNSHLCFIVDIGLWVWRWLLMLLCLF